MTPWEQQRLLEEQLRKQREAEAARAAAVENPYGFPDIQTPQWREVQDWLGQGAVGDLPHMATPQYKEVQDWYNELQRSRIGEAIGETPSGGGGEGGYERPRSVYHPPTRYEQTGLDRLADYMSLRGMPGQYSSAMSALEMLLSGEPTPGFKEHVADPMRGAFEEEVLPGIKSAYVGPGTYWGSERAGAETKARGALEESIGGLRYKAEESALARALSAAPQLATLAQYEAELPLRQARAGLGLGGLERSIADEDFRFAYQDFLRSQPQMDSSLLQLILAFLGQGQQAWMQ